VRATDVAELLPYLTEDERAELGALLAADKTIWRPLPGPQSRAYNCTVDVVGYGGAAGGGKTDLACGKALTQHARTMILRRTAPELIAITDRLEELLGHKEGFNGQDKIWRLGKRQIEFGSVPNAGDEKKYQGRPHDLIVFDEAANFLESQVRFLLGWLRTTTPGQRCQALLTFNPPTSAEGRWIVAFFAPWLDDKHPNPAKPGEVRFFAMVDGKEIEVPTGEPFHHGDELIKPQSRTFFLSLVDDNPFWNGTGYKAMLQALPEPLRSQMLKGDFGAGMEDDKWQVIPTAWVDAAMARWAPRTAKGVMDSMGVDVARGGRDHTIVARRHGAWFDELIDAPGTETPDGPVVFGQVMAHRRDKAVVHIDIVGWGSSPYDFLVDNDVQTVGVNGANKSFARTKDSLLAFYNMRAEVWWAMREALDPTAAEPIALPNDPGLRADLCAPRYSVKPTGILIESKEEIDKRIGRSPDKGDAVCLALMATPKDDAPTTETPAVRHHNEHGWMG
jgi:hypothetical protein